MNAELRQLADWIDQRLDNEHVDRQTVCEDVAGKLRRLAATAPAAPELEARRTAAAAVLADFRREVDESPLSRPLDRVWMLRLASSLGEVLDQGAGFTPQQREVLAQVVEDALNWRDPSGICTECEARPDGLCSGHAEDLDRTDSYLALAEALGIELDL